jgi:hypothetical protein
MACGTAQTKVISGQTPPTSLARRGGRLGEELLEGGDWAEIVQALRLLVLP